MVHTPRRFDYLTALKKAIYNRALFFAAVLCALFVTASSQLAEMHGQEKITRPSSVSELPTREPQNESDSLPPIIYGNQTPFGEISQTEQLDEGQIDETQIGEEQVDESSVLDSEPAKTHTVAKPSLPVSASPTPSQGELPDRDLLNPGPLELVEPLPAIPSPTSVRIPPSAILPFNPAPAFNPQPIPNPPSFVEPLPLPAVPLVTQPAPSASAIGSVPVTAFDIAPTNGCAVCGEKRCKICCQPKCITKTILIPKYHTVWSSIFETRYRTEIKEQAYTVEEEVQHQVPRIIQETVMVAEPRIRTFQDFREEEYQVPVQEPYSVMVRKPRQRMVPVEREETYRYPVEQEYTEMEPREKIVTETKYKTIIDKEPRQKKFTVEVERKKKRIVVDYVEEEVKITKREPANKVVPVQNEREVWKYRNVTKTQIIKEPYYDYEEVVKQFRTLKPQLTEGTRTVEVDEIEYQRKTKRFQQSKIEQVAKPKKIPQTYTVAVPYVEKAYENYTISEPYEEEVVISLKTRRQEPREVTRNYTVKIPYIENIPRQYKIKVPIQVMKKGKRYIPKQIPRTKYQAVKRDVGQWVTTVDTIPTYEIESDRCGCSTCCPKNRTVRKTVWQPRIVTSQKPYTVFETVKQEIPYEYPVLEHRYEIRDRMEPVTRYRSEQREATLTVYDFKPATDTKTVTVRKYKQVPQRREITIQKFREEKRTRMVDIEEYENVESAAPYDVNYEEANITKQNTQEKFTSLSNVEGPTVESKILKPVLRYRDKEVKFVVREPYREIVPYTENVTVKDFRNVEKVVKVQVPKPRVEEYVEKVPEIRTKIEFVDVEKRVPYVETKTITEMVPVKKTRTIYKTDVRTVSELKPEVFFEDVEEVFNRTVYKKKFRNVPVNRAEINWVKVPKVLKKTIFKTVTRKVKRPALRRVPVRVPYQVEVRIPRRLCTMVPHTITIPVEECCEHCTWHLPGVATATNAWLEYSRTQASKLFWWVRDE